jgi:AcrR family transcriptional regulator
MVRAPQKRALATRQALLDAAIEAFCESGYEGTTARIVAKKAGVNHALINYHFGSKENLWRACADQLFNAYNAAMARRRESLQGLDEPIILHLMLREFVSYMVAVPHFQQFLVLANLGDTDRFAWLNRRYLAPAGSGELAILRAAQRAGVFRSGDPHHLRCLFISAAASVCLYGREMAGLVLDEESENDLVDRHIDLVLDLFAPNLSRP